MRRHRLVLSVALALVALALILAACGGGDDEDDATATPPASEAPNPRAPDQGAPPSLGAFPPEFIQCLKDQGIDVEGADPQELFHGGAVPPQALQACFGALHGGGGAP